MGEYQHGYLHRPAYPFRYTRGEVAQDPAKSLAEVLEVAAEYENRFNHPKTKQSEDGPPSRVTGLYKYNKNTKSVYRSDVDPHDSDTRIRLEDVEEMQKKLNEEAKHIKKNIECLNVKLQTVHRTIDYTKPRRVYRDNLGLGIRPSKLYHY